MAAEISIISLNRTVKYSSCMADELKQLRDAKIFVDFKIIIKKQVINCHKLIIALHSPILKSMLISDMVETTDDELRLDHISLDIMHIILDYMYCGTVSLHKEQLLETILAADYLQMSELKELCLAEAPSIIARINVTSWWKLASKIGLHDIKKHCKEFIVKDFYKVTKQADFLGLTHGEMQHYFADVVTEDIHGDDILDATLRWVKQEEKPRHEHLDDLTNRIDLDRCTVQYMKSALKIYEELMDKDPRIYKKMSTALVNVQTRQMLQKPKPTSQSLLVVGGKEEEINRVCWKLQESSDPIKLCDIPYRLRQHSACKTPMGFAVTGGDQCFMFITALHAWSRMANMQAKRTGHGSVCHRRTLMVMGGWQEDSNSKSVEMMDMEEGSWIHGPDMLVSCRFPKLAHIGDDPGIYLLNEASRELFFLDMEGKEWTSKARLPIAYDCSGCSMTTTRGMLYVAGGKFRVFASYNPATDTWSLGPQPAQHHIYGSLVSHEEKLLLLGGSWKNGTDEIEEFDFTDGKWTICTKYRMPANGLYIHHGLVLETQAHE